MHTQLNIRSATSSDAANIAALAMQVWLHTYSREGIRQEISEFVFAEFTPPIIAKLIQDPAKTVLVACDNQHLLGYAVLQHGSVCPSDQELKNELATLYVHTHFAGQGIGTALLKACSEQGFLLDGSRAIWLKTWHRNSKAIAFYLKQGYTQIGSTFFQLGNEQHENFVFAKRE